MCKCRRPAAVDGAHKGAQRPCGVIYRSLSRRHLHMMTHPLHPGGLCVCSGLSQYMALCLGFLWRHGIAARSPKNSLQSNDKGSKTLKARGEKKTVTFSELGVQKGNFTTPTDIFGPTCDLEQIYLFYVIFSSSGAPSRYIRVSKDRLG